MAFASTQWECHDLTNCEICYLLCRVDQFVLIFVNMLNGWIHVFYGYFVQVSVWLYTRLDNRPWAWISLTVSRPLCFITRATFIFISILHITTAQLDSVRVDPWYREPTHLHLQTFKLEHKEPQLRIQPALWNMDYLFIAMNFKRINHRQSFTESNIHNEKYVQWFDQISIHFSIHDYA